MRNLGKHIKEFSLRNKTLQCKKVFSVTNSEGFIPSTDYFSKEVFSKDLSNYKIVKRGMVAFNPSRINVGSIANLETEDEVVISPLYIVFKTDDTLDAKFLTYFLKSDLGNKQIRNLTSGSVRDSLKYSALEKIRIPSISISQQKELVIQLDKIKKIICLKKSYLQQLDNLIKSRFVEMFGDPVKNEKRWEINNLGDLGYFKNGMNFNQSDEGYILKFLGVGEFKKLTRIDSVSILSELELSNKPSDEYLLQKGDIVFVRSNGSKELVGRSVLIGELEEPATYSGFCIRFRNQSQKIQPDFLIRLFADDNFKKTFKQDSRGANINNLNQTMLSGLRIIVPPIELQNRFTAFIQVTDKLKVEVQESLNETQMLFDSLMQQYFE